MTDARDRPIVVGTRGSALALWQAEYIVSRLRSFHPQREFIIKPIHTGGDRNQRAALAAIGTRGIFVKEIENALLAGEIDLAIHSLKDLPSKVGDGLALAAVSPREDPRDVLVTRHRCSLQGLPANARVGTSSPRRAAQLRALRPDLVIENVRGNVDTRVRKALSAELDGVVLAAAGLHRLGLAGEISEYIDLSVMVPAPGQGIIAIEARADNQETMALAATTDDANSHAAALAERAFVRALGGGCFTPLGAYAVVRNGVLHLVGLLANPSGTTVLRLEIEGDASTPEPIGLALASRLKAAGGDRILAQIGQEVE